MNSAARKWRLEPTTDSFHRLPSNCGIVSTRSKSICTRLIVSMTHWSTASWFTTSSRRSIRSMMEMDEWAGSFWH